MAKDPLEADAAEEYRRKKDRYRVGDTSSYENNQRTKHEGNTEYKHESVKKDGSADIQSMLENSEKLGDQLE